MSGEEKKELIPIRDANGREIDRGCPKDILEETTPWSIFKLDDGTIIKIKVVVLNVLCTEKYTPAGEPIYSVKTHNIIISESPEALKKTPTIDSETETISEQGV
jgi:hypothetical protein